MGRPSSPSLVSANRVDRGHAAHAYRLPRATRDGSLEAALSCSIDLSFESVGSAGSQTPSSELSVAFVQRSSKPEQFAADAAAHTADDVLDRNGSGVDPSARAKASPMLLENEMFIEHSPGSPGV